MPLFDAGLGEGGAGVLFPRVHSGPTANLAPIQPHRLPLGGHQLAETALGAETDLGGVDLQVARRLGAALVSEPVEGRQTMPGRCEVDGCGARVLFRDETRCFKHQPVTRIVIRLADGQRFELPGPPPNPEAA